MTDQKPPLVQGQERETLVALLQYQRESIVRKFDGLGEDAARRVFVPSGTTLLWLLKHIARAEQSWIVQRFAGQEPTVPNDTVGPDDSVATALAAYRATWARVDAIVAAASLEDTCLSLREGQLVNLRWVLMHVLEETARHAGHVDILRELVDGSTGR
jgi:uncharacterized damage-inducible protein DinB